LYLGRVPDEARARMPGLGEQGAAGPGFDLLLDRIGHFPRSGIIWAGTTSVPDALVTLHQRLVGAARELGLDPPARDFLPHVTLLRAAHAGPDWQPERVLCWPVDGFRLVASRLSSTGPDYTTLATWSLGPTPGESVGGGATDDAPDEA
ncbi:MAG: hypothetical protein KDK91_24360, partial [Gammaproteobacteria bacterium]|nr:hypothetical protein [Gammaproteobacteria bacterium]